MGGIVALTVERKKSVRHKLALLAAVAVVFAPGWHASGSPDSSPASAELTARVLAPTFDDARVSSKADRGLFKRLEPNKSSPFSSKSPAWTDARSALFDLDRLWLTLALAAALTALAGALYEYPSRAPPSPLTV